MKTKLTKTKTKKKRWKNRYAKLNRSRYTLNINWKGKRTVGKANKGINVEKIIIGLKIKIKRREKKKKKN